MASEDQKRSGESESLFDESVLGPPPLSTTVTVMLAIYFVILVPWIPFFTLMGTGMAFEGGNTFDAYQSVIIFLAFPVLVSISYLFRRRKPALVWLPMIPLTLALLEML